MLPILPALLAIILGSFGDVDRPSFSGATSRLANPSVALAVIAHYWIESVAAETYETAAISVRKSVSISKVRPETPAGDEVAVPSGHYVGSRTRDGP